MSVLCPECRTPCSPTANRCPGCGFPLVLQARPQEQREVDHRLFVRPGDATAEDPDAAATDRAADRPGIPGEHRTPVRPYGARPAGTVPAPGPVCPSCRRRNPPDRKRWCAWCAAELVPSREPAGALPDWGPAPVRRGRGWLLGAAAVTALLVVAVWAVLAGRGA
ncbi:MAG TPA: hypothetical protein VFP72_12215 [Kineosporiaceae bacterium]|nr:hypothetical protein [Kineosporiaceae bacterium]